MLLLCVVIELETYCCGSKIIENSKQKTTKHDNVLLLVENCDIKLEILNKSTHLNQSQTQITVMSDLFFCEGFSLVHVIITKTINGGKGQRCPLHNNGAGILMLPAKEYLQLYTDTETLD